MWLKWLLWIFNLGNHLIVLHLFRYRCISCNSTCALGRKYSLAISLSHVEKFIFYKRWTTKIKVTSNKITLRKLSKTFMCVVQHHHAIYHGSDSCARWIIDWVSVWPAKDLKEPVLNRSACSVHLHSIQSLLGSWYL